MKAEASGPPHSALFLVLAYLPLHQVLSMTQVCKSLRDAIATDVLIWLHLLVEMPLSLRFTDEFMMKITSRAQGRLRTLALLNCTKITDDGLLGVVTANPHISKLYVPACTGLTPEGILKAVKILAERSPNTLTTLKINGIYNLTQQHLQTLQSSLSKSTIKKPIFYHRYNNLVFGKLDENDSPIDVDICSGCGDVKIVFDCPKENCKRRMVKSYNKCRGCSYCIIRCEGCGICLEDDDEQGETICNDNLCLDCWFCLPKCNFCNKPFCYKHTELFGLSTSGGFVCDICHDKSSNLGK